MKGVKHRVQLTKREMKRKIEKDMTTRVLKEYLQEKKIVLAYLQLKIKKQIDFEK